MYYKKLLKKNTVETKKSEKSKKIKKKTKIKKKFNTLNNDNLKESEEINELLSTHSQTDLDSKKIQNNLTLDVISLEAVKKNTAAEKKKKKLQKKLENIKHKKENSLPAKHPDAEICTIFVGNVHMDCKKNEIFNFFSQYGMIDTVRFRGIYPEASINKKAAMCQNRMQKFQKSKIAFIRFIDQESKEASLSATGMLLHDLHLTVDYSSQSVRWPNTIFIGNLPWTIADEDLWRYFSELSVQRVKLVRSAKSGVGKGFGYVSFESPDDVSKALLYKKSLQGQKLRIMKVVRKIKSKAIKSNEGMEMLIADKKRGEEALAKRQEVHERQKQKTTDHKLMWKRRKTDEKNAKFISSFQGATAEEPNSTKKRKDDNKLKYKRTQKDIRKTKILKTLGILSTKEE